MIFYVLLSYGPKPTGPLRNHPAAVAQMRLFDLVVAQCQPEEDRRLHDYARSVAGLGSLPRLQKMLVALSGHGTGSVVVDDPARIFRICPLKARQQLLAEMLAFKNHLHSIKHGKALTSFSETEISDLILHPEKSKNPAQPRRNCDTSDARVASLKSRTETALQKAHALAEIKDRLRLTNKGVTLKMIADAANSIGLRTTRGRLWTAPNVARALLLLN